LVARLLALLSLRVIVFATISAPAQMTAAQVIPAHAFRRWINVVFFLVVFQTCSRGLDPRVFLSLTISPGGGDSFGGMLVFREITRSAVFWLRCRADG